MRSLLSNNSGQQVSVPSHCGKSPYPVIHTDGTGHVQPQRRRSFVYPYLENDDARDHVGLDSVSGDEETKVPCNDHNGRRILGLTVSEGLAHRKRIESNETVQAIANNHDGFGSHSAEAIVWLSLQRGGYEKCNNEGNNRGARFVVPYSSSLRGSSHLEKITLSSAHPAEFDDKRFAEQPQAGHRKLAGP